ncbi:MAG: integration host factor subunit beta [bacterium]|nr:integration host factor subunit beta [bacterium]
MVKTITKRDLVERVADGVEAEPALVRDVIQLLLDTIIEHLVDGNRVELRNFGVFSVKRRRPRIGRNPRKPDETVQIPVTPTPIFKAGRHVKLRVKNQTQ